MSTWKTYIVTMIRSEVMEIEIKARNLGEAETKALNKSDEAEPHFWGEPEIESINEKIS
ncbi:hypothetical protein LCGC14_0739950 [marine sediment metagenome]|uniref:Uncharacterized protein n=1 Tax=marine sediment metagenome TaxID=412755 RepID=A0A0F9QBD6_9ZZZZ